MLTPRLIFGYLGCWLLSHQRIPSILFYLYKSMINKHNNYQVKRYFSSFSEILYLEIIFVKLSMTDKIIQLKQNRRNCSTGNVVVLDKK